MKNVILRKSFAGFQIRTGAFWEINKLFCKKKINIQNYFFKKTKTMYMLFLGFFD